MRAVGTMLFVMLLAACGASNAAAPTPSPTPTPTATPLYLIGIQYSAAINKLHDSTATDSPAYYNSKAGSPEASTAARKLADDYQTLLNDLDAISFPPNAQSDLAAFRKAVGGLQVFWSNVSVADSNYSDPTQTALNNDYNNAGILLGHDVGTSPTLEKPSPTPS